MNRESCPELITTYEMLPIEHNDRTSFYLHFFNFDMIIKTLTMLHFRSVNEVEPADPLFEKDVNFLKC